VTSLHLIYAYVEYTVGLCLRVCVCLCGCYRDWIICIAALWNVTEDWKARTVWWTVVGWSSCLTGVSAVCIHQYMKLTRKPTAVSQ